MSWLEVLSVTVLEEEIIYLMSPHKQTLLVTTLVLSHPTVDSDLAALGNSII